MSRVDITNKFEKKSSLRDSGVNVRNRGRVWDVRELVVRGRMPIMNAPVHSSMVIECQTFESTKVKMTWGLGKLRKSGDGITDIAAANNICIKDLTEESAVGESKFRLKGSMLGSMFGRSNSVVETRN